MNRNHGVSGRLKSVRRRKRASQAFWCETIALKVRLVKARKRMGR